MHVVRPCQPANARFVVAERGGWCGQFLRVGCAAEDVQAGRIASSGQSAACETRRARCGVRRRWIIASLALQTHEIGIRMALGAARHRIIQMVLRKGLVLIAAGLGLGLAGSLASTRIIASELEGIRALDPWTYTGALLLMIAAGSAACLLPARRAAKVDPLDAIRCE